MLENKRCPWVKHGLVEENYHDKVWGKELHDEKQLFKMLMLEGMQAGLSWITILKKQEALEEAFVDFDPNKLILFDEEAIQRLLNNPGIIRSRRKIEAVILNAKCYLEHFNENGLDDYLWAYVNYKPVINHYHTLEEVPASTELSTIISNDLKKKGFKFIGPTIIYAYMQAIGMVNDHLESCDYKY